MRRRVPALLVLSLVAACKGDSTQPAEFSITPSDVELSVGDTRQLSAVGAPGPVVWSSSRESVASVVPETGFVTANARGAAQISAVSGSAVASADVTVRQPPTIALSQSTATLETLHDTGDPQPVSVQIQNTGDDPLLDLTVGTIQYGEGEPSGWLGAQVAGVQAPTDLTLSASVTGLPPGTYTATVPLQSASAINSPQQLAVILRLLTPPSIMAAQSEVTLTAIPGETGQDVIQITNGGTAPLTDLEATIEYTGAVAGPARGEGTGARQAARQGVDWLSAALSSSSAPADLTLTAMTGGLDVGTYEATVTVSSATDPGVTPFAIDVTFILSPGPAIALAPANAVFNAVPNEAPPAAQDVQITNAGGGTLSGLSLGAIQYGAGASGWLGAVLNATTAPTTLTLSVNHAGLAQGTYTATVPIMSPVASNSPTNLTVTLHVGPPPVIHLDDSDQGFESFEGGSDPPAEVVGVSNSGGGELGQVQAIITSISAPGGWLDFSWIGPAEVTTANPEARLQVQPDVSGLSRGTYFATIEISAPGSSAAPETVDVVFTVYSFAADISGLFDMDSSTPYGTDSCSGCHTQMGSTAASRYDWARDRVTPFSPGASSLYCRITSSCGVAPMPLGDSAQRLIELWINRGAPFN